MGWSERGGAVWDGVRGEGQCGMEWEGRGSVGWSERGGAVWDGVRGEGQCGME